MRTLKKTLCLVLAMTMVLGFFGVAFAKNASEYPDYDETQYKEAVDVMVGIGVIDGMGGEINPNGKVTRAQAAKMVTYAILGKDNIGELSTSTSSFADVNSYYDWAIPSIEYLADKGIVSGRSGLGGNYDPEGEVTAHELAKMLLCAVGYGVKDEYIGNGWELPVAVDATRLGVFEGCKASNRNSAATREECAKYIFNAIVHINQVVWDNGKELYVSSPDTNDKDFGTIAAEIYGLRYDNGPTNTGTLAYDANTTDAYGRPATSWAYRGKTISFIVDTPVLTFNDNYVPAEVYKTLKDDGYKFGKDFATVTNSLDGKAIVSKKFGTNTDKTTNKKGTVTEFFVNSKNVVTKMVTIETMFLGVTDIKEDNTKTAIDERSITFTVPGIGNVKATPDTENFDTVYAAAKALIGADKEAGALVVVNYGDDKATMPVLSVSLPTFEELKVTSVKNTTDSNPVSFVADGNTYYYAAKNSIWFKANPLNAGGTYVVYFDAYGNAVYATVVEESLNVSAVLDIGVKTDGFKKIPQVKVLGTDGEVTVLPVKGTLDDLINPTKITIGKDAEENDIDIVENNIVTYRALSGAYEGLYELSLIKTPENNVGTLITNGSVDFGNNFKANAKTIFLVETKDATTDKLIYNSYTGIKAVPTVESCDSITVYNAKADGYADVVFVKNAIVKLAADDITFIAIDSKEIKNADGTVVHDAALISGPDMTNVKTTKVTANVKTIVDANNCLVSAYTEKDGLITAVEPYTDDTNNSNFGVGVNRASNEVVTLDTANANPNATKSHTYTDDCMVWVIDPSTEQLVAKKVSTITKDVNDTVIWIENTESKQVSAIYIIKDNRSSDASVSSVKVNGIEATVNAENAKVYDVVVPFGTDLAELDISVTPATKATVGEIAKSEAGNNYTFTVTAEDEIYSADYTINVNVAPEEPEAPEEG